MVKPILQLSLSLLLAMLALVLVGGVLASAPPDPGSGLAAMASLDRDLEPVIVEGIFSGVPLDQIFVYRENSGAWEQIPFQIDELTGSGTYTTTEDSLMDANDEVVFMTKDLGDQATTSITTSLPISPFWYEVEVADPLSPTKKGWAYIVRSNVLTPSSAVDYADYIPTDRRISAENYTVGWATSHAGLDYMSLFGGGDILDRTKLRVRYTLIIPFDLTEEDFPAPPLVPIRDRAVRVIVRRGSATTFAYASFMQTLMPVDLSSLPGTLNEIRLSTDFTHTVTGTYYDENIPTGVTIDGSPDFIATDVLTKPWRQVSLNSGTIIQIADAGSLDGDFRHYYKDDSIPDPIDTGDGMSYGDSGVQVTNPTSRQFTFQTVQYVLPDQQSNQGDQFYEMFQNPVSVKLTFHSEADHSVYLPLILKSM